MSVLVSLALKTTVVLGAAWFAVALLRKGSSAIRYQVWVAAILCLLALPLLEPALPQWSSPRFVSQVAVRHNASTSDAPRTVVRVTARRIPRRTVNHIVVWTWAAGTAAMLLRLVVALTQLSWAGAQARLLSTHASFRKAASVAASLGAPPSVRLLISNDRLTMPLTWGVFHPRILLPLDAMEWPEERFRLVLAHELAHIARHDWILRICGELACALYWFHPRVTCCSVDARRK